MDHNKLMTAAARVLDETRRGVVGRSEADVEQAVSALLAIIPKAVDVVNGVRGWGNVDGSQGPLTLEAAERRIIEAADALAEVLGMDPT